MDTGTAGGACGRAILRGGRSAFFTCTPPRPTHRASDSMSFLDKVRALRAAFSVPDEILGIICPRYLLTYLRTYVLTY